MPIVAVLGGSTPFTAALIEALRDARADLPRCELRLCGRDVEAVARIVAYGDRRLGGFGWTVIGVGTTDEAVDGADVVVNQIRFGGLEGRDRDEALANRFQLPADETLGPCGLTGALRVVPKIRALAEELGRHCPDAWVLNLSNPLSVTTHALLTSGGPRRSVGLCELPRVTVEEACRVLGIAARSGVSEIEWDYSGLNHRGFIHSLRWRGEELLPLLSELLGERTIFGVTADDVRRLGALPLKYFRLSTAPTHVEPTARARFLVDLRAELSRELDEGLAPPPSLSKRDLSWYACAVVPMLAAIFQADGRRIVVNCLRDDGLVHEVPARVVRSSTRPAPSDRMREDAWSSGPPARASASLEVLAVRAPPHLQPWLDRWMAHERAVLEAVKAPTFERIEHALELDPSVPRAQVSALAQAIWMDGREGETWGQTHCG